MTSARPYRTGLSPEVAIEEIVRCRGTQFNPRLTDYFISALRVQTPHPRVLPALEIPVFNSPVIAVAT